MLGGILLSLLNGLAWVYVGVVVSAANRKQLPYNGIVFLNALISIIIGFFTLSLMGRSMLPAREECIVAFAMFLAGVLNGVMLTCVQRAMKSGPNGIVWGVVQSGMLGPFLMGVLFFNVAPTAMRIAGLILILTNVVLSGVGGKDENKAVPKTGWFRWALLGFLFCALNQCCSNLPSYMGAGAELGGIYRATICQVGMLCYFGISLLVKRELATIFCRGPHTRQMLFYSISLSVVGILSSFFVMYRALDLLAESGSGSIGFPLMVSTCVAGFYVYARFFHKEKTSPAQNIGFAAGVLGMIAICL